MSSILKPLKPDTSIKFIVRLLTRISDTWGQSDYFNCKDIRGISYFNNNISSRTMSFSEAENLMKQVCVNDPGAKLVIEPAPHDIV
jgi:hypothetical protein